MLQVIEVGKLAKMEEHDCKKPCHMMSTSELKNLNMLLGDEIQSDYCVEVKLEQTSLSESFTPTLHKPLQLQIILDRLNISNESHKNAIDNLPKLKIILNKLDLNNGSKEGESHGRFSHKSVKRKTKIEDKNREIYKCPRCPYESHSFLSLSSHYIFHGGKLNFTFSCPDCDYTATLPSALSRHKQKHKKKPDLSCPHCPYKTRWDCSLRIHLRRWHLPAHEAKTLNCTQCNFVSVCRTTFETHLTVHMKRGKAYLARFLHDGNEEDIVKCKFCLFRTPNEVALRRHLLDTHKIDESLENKLHKCNYCGFETKHRFSLKDHLLLHKDVEDADLLRCYHCGFKTKWKKYLLLHMRTDHPRGNQEKKKTPRYQCAECGKKFFTKYPLKVHILMKHGAPERLACQYCTYSTINKYALRRHIDAIHINPIQRTYPCYLCSKISKDRAAHKAHIRTHTFTCYTCGAELNNKSTLADHMGTHMSIEEQRERYKMFNCEHCDYETRNKPRYERHMGRWNHYPNNVVMSSSI